MVPFDSISRRFTRDMDIHVYGIIDKLQALAIKVALDVSPSRFFE